MNTIDRIVAVVEKLGLPLAYHAFKKGNDSQVNVQAHHRIRGVPIYGGRLHEVFDMCDDRAMIETNDGYSFNGLDRVSRRTVGARLALHERRLGIGKTCQPIREPMTLTTVRWLDAEPITFIRDPHEGWRQHSYAGYSFWLGEIA